MELIGGERSVARTFALLMHLSQFGFTVVLGLVALAALPGDELDVVVGGLGLGYTAQRVLDDPRVPYLAEMMNWPGATVHADTADEPATLVLRAGHGVSMAPAPRMLPPRQ